MKPRPLHITIRSLGALCLTALSALSARADGPAAILADAPKAFYHFNDNTNRNLSNLNLGTLGASGNASNDVNGIYLGTDPNGNAFYGGAVHSIPGAIVGDPDRASFYDFTTRSEIPFNAAVNPPATQPFTLEAWLLPSSDAVNNGMGVLCNRWTQGGARQGWVLYQRAADTNHCTSCGPGLGWEFRMYNGVDGSGHVDVTSGVPFTLGQWQHVVVVYIPVGGNPNNSMATIYVNGVAAATNVNSNPSVPGYGACTGDHDPGQAINGQPALSIGGYNNANSGTYGFANPWFGGADEFALYATNLTPAQILSHYQNGTNANRSQPYSALVQSAHPVVYLRLNETAANGDVINNVGDTRSFGIGVNTNSAMTVGGDVKHPALGALAGRPEDGAGTYHQRSGNSATDIPWLAANNPNAGVPFTFETWLRPTSDRQNPGAAPFNNRYVSSGDRTGWVIFQRAPDVSYAPVSGYSGVGWNFRMYSGAGGSGQDVTTSVGYVPGKWQHLVVTWEPQTEIGIVGRTGANDQWQGVLTAYFNGVPVATNAAALYSANLQNTDDGSPAADLAVGAYNAASGLGANPYEGDIDEVAFYPNTVLTTNQIWQHYAVGTNVNSGTNYETLVYYAGIPSSSFTNASGQVAEHKSMPSLYLRFNDAPYFGAANLGSLGAAANASLVNTTNIAAGFAPGTLALPLDGFTQFASLNNPAGLNLGGQITLEAWVQPASAQNATARIISHGPETISSYPGPLGGTAVGPFVNAITNTSEVFLRLEGNGATYAVGNAHYDDSTGVTTVNEATYAIPGADLTGSAWVHLVGTYDGTKWNLYRNGHLVASQASPTGALPNGGDWTIGASGPAWADNFAGTVGDVAIYDHALSAGQVAAHYVSTTSGSANLTIVPAAGGKVQITWPAGTTLLSSTKAGGPYTAVTGATSPLLVTATGTKFYRWVLP